MSYRTTLGASLLLISLGLWPTQIHAVGALTPFWTFEAESGTLGGAATVQTFIPGSPIPSESTPAFEASGRAYVSLVNVGDSITLTNTNTDNLPASTIVVRNCIPDAPAGGGITATLDLYVNGVFNEALNFSSAQTYIYETDPNANGQSKDPSAGYPHHFWYEAKAFIAGSPIPAGATFTLQKDAANTAAFYDIDCVDLEDPTPKTQPANSLSITSYGAVTGTTDSSASIQACMNAAASEGETVWIPPGLFTIASSVSPDNITVTGAGMWYSEIYCLVPAGGATQITPQGGILEDLSEDSNMPDRDAGFSGINITGDNWTIQRVWVQHGNAAFWCTGVNGIVQDCRVSDSWADGINLNNNNGAANGLGVSLTAQNNFVRGTDDDCMAINSQMLTTGVGTNMQDTRFLNNTTSCGIWGNGLRIAGGTNDVVQDNLVMDSADQNGLIAGCFGPGSTAGPLINALVTGNTVIRGSGLRSSSGIFADTSAPLPLSVTFTGNTDLDSLQTGFLVGNSATDSVLCIDNVINHPATAGIVITQGATGGAVFQSNLVENLNTCQLAYENLAPSTYPVTLTANTFINGPGCAGKYEAELAVLSGTVQVSSDPAASNGYEVIDMSQGSSITWDDVIAGTQLAITYNTENNPGKMDLYVNGTFIETVSFPDTASWSGSYSTVTLTVAIPAGATVALVSDAGDSGTNFDYIQISGEPTPTGTASFTRTPSDTTSKTATETATGSETATLTTTQTPTASATETRTATVSPTVTFSGTHTDSPSATASASPSSSASPSATPAPEPTASPSQTASPATSPTPSATPLPGMTETASPSPTRTFNVTAIPIPTDTATMASVGGTGQVLQVVPAPNPQAGPTYKFYVKLGGPVGTLEGRLYSVAFVPVAKRSFPVDGADGWTLVTWDIPGLANGLYYAYFNVGSGQHGKTGKLMVLR